MEVQERFAKLNESQKISDDLLKNLCETLEKTNEEQEDLSTKIDDLLRLQNDSHYTIGGVIREKLEDLEATNDVFREQLEGSTTTVSEALQKKMAAIAVKFSESERVISNMATEVSLLKIGVNLFKNSIAHQEYDPEAVDVTTTGETPLDEPTTSEEKKMKYADENSLTKEKQELAEVPPSNGKSMKEMTDEEKKLKVAEMVVEKKLIGELEWMKKRIVVHSEGVMIKEGLTANHLIPLQRFLYLAKNRPDLLFREEKYEVDCYNCPAKTLITFEFLHGNSHPCCSCQTGVVLGNPPAEHDYIITDCGHINVAPVYSDLPMRCASCKEIPKSGVPIDEQIRFMKRVELTDRQVLERTLQYAHLQWIKEKIVLLEDDFVKTPNGSVLDKADPAQFLKVVLGMPWMIFPEEFEVDCYFCKKIIPIMDNATQLYTVLCPHCSKTTVISPMRFNEQNYQIVKFACGHYDEVRERQEKKFCVRCDEHQIVSHSKKNIRVMWRKGKSTEETWNPQFLITEKKQKTSKKSK